MTHSMRRLTDGPPPDGFDQADMELIQKACAVVMELLDLLPSRIAQSVVASMIITMLVNDAKDPFKALDDLTNLLRPKIQRALNIKDTAGSA